MTERKTRILWACAWLWASWAGAAMAAGIAQNVVAPGVVASIKNGRLLYLECTLPKGSAAKAFLAPYLADPKQWTVYKDRAAVAIPYNSLAPSAQRKTLEAVFPKDYVDEQGWWHTVTFGRGNGMESWWALCEWLTGVGTNQDKVMSHPLNRKAGKDLEPGEKVLIPSELLKLAFRTPSPPERRQQAGEAQNATLVGMEPEESDLTEASDETAGLEYGSDKKGKYAIYRLRRGETLYTSVVVRFTDFRENNDILEACKTVQERSGIADPSKMEPGDRVLIPVDLLADRYQPTGSAGRDAYESVRKEARELQSKHAQAKELKGVVIVLDPGHGGRDRGAALFSQGVVEAEINYDIVCRIKALFESQTRAKVYVTMLDPDRQYRPTAATRFSGDNKEVLLTTPNYPNNDAEISAHLRWSLANSILRKEKANGVAPTNMLFASIHCNSLDPRLRGTMVYVPGARYRDGSGGKRSPIYAQYQESRGSHNARVSAADARRDEAVSTLAANLLVQRLAQHKPAIKVHDKGDPILNVIKKSKSSAFLPAVLRYNLIPTKFLVEIANINNPTDQKRLLDPQWRQGYAEAFVSAVRAYFAS